MQLQNKTTENQKFSQTFWSSRGEEIEGQSSWKIGNSELFSLVFDGKKEYVLLIEMQEKQAADSEQSWVVRGLREIFNFLIW